MDKTGVVLIALMFLLIGLGGAGVWCSSVQSESLMQECLSDGVPRYECYGYIYGGRR